MDTIRIAKSQKKCRLQAAVVLMCLVGLMRDQQGKVGAVWVRWSDDAGACCTPPSTPQLQSCRAGVYVFVAYDCQEVRDRVFE